MDSSSSGQLFINGIMVCFPSWALLHLPICANPEGKWTQICVDAALHLPILQEHLCLNTAVDPTSCDKVGSDLDGQDICDVDEELWISS